MIYKIITNKTYYAPFPWRSPALDLLLCVNIIMCTNLETGESERSRSSSPSQKAIYINNKITKNTLRTPIPHPPANTITYTTLIHHPYTILMDN